MRRFMSVGIRNQPEACSPDVCQVTKDESPIEVETAGNDVPGVLSRKLLNLIQFELVLE